MPSIVQTFSGGACPRTPPPRKTICHYKNVTSFLTNIQKFLDPPLDEGEHHLKINRFSLILWWLAFGGSYPASYLLRLMENLEKAEPYQSLPILRVSEMHFPAFWGKNLQNYLSLHAVSPSLKWSASLFLPQFSRHGKMAARARNAWPWDSFFKLFGVGLNYLYTGECHATRNYF